jgi:hypothetical protein
MFFLGARAGFSSIVGPAMHSQNRRRKCRCCKEFFLADYRNGYHQVYCSKPPCRAASKEASQRRWLSQPGNRDYFRSPENVARVKQWRQGHPGYWKPKSAPPGKPQKPEPEALGSGSHLVTQPRKSPVALQDLCLADHPVFIGLISMVTGVALQEDIALTTRKLEARGRDILGLALQDVSPPVYDHQTRDST